MQTIALVEVGKFKVADLIRTVTSTDQRGMTFADMRKRNRILDALDKSTDELTLEDAEYSMLKDIIQVFPFAIATKDLETAILHVVEPKPAPKTALHTPKSPKAAVEPPKPG